MKRSWSFLRKYLNPLADGRPRRRALVRPVIEEFEKRLTPAAPSVVSINRVAPAAFSSASSLDFAVTFSQPVTGVDGADFQVVKTGTATTSTLQVAGSGAAYTVTVGGIAGNGTVGLNLVDNNSIRNSANNPLYAANGAASFLGVHSFSTGLASGTIAVADFNADGKLDVALVDYYLSSAPTGILFGNGDGTFQAPRIFGGVYEAVGVEAEDMNGDGKPDLVIVNNAFQQGGAGAVILGNGDGTFKPRQIFQADNQSGPLAVADLNGDGKPDVVTASYTGRMSILLGNGDGGFKPRTTYTAGRATSVQVGDINNDNYPDIIVGNQRDNSFGIYLGNGDGTYQSPKSLSMGFNCDFDLADVDGDGKLDLIATNYGASVFRFLGNGDGTFRAPTTYPTVGNAVGIDLADLNGDGMLDVVIGQTNGGSAGMLLGTPGGNFGPYMPLSAGFAAHNVAIADVNNDSRPEILAVGRYNARYFGSFVNAANGNFTGDVGAIDQTAPVLTLTSKPPAVALKQSATFAFTAADPQVGGIASGIHHVEYQLDAGPITHGTSPLVFNALAAGSHTLTARAVDNAGNVGAPVSDTWVVDLISPPKVDTVVRTSPASSFIGSSSVVYSLRFNGVVTGFDANDLATVVSGSVTTGSIVVAGNGDTYTVTVHGVAGDGSLALKVKDDDSIVSTLNGLPIGGTGADNGAFIGANENVDRTAPVAAITAQPPLDTTARTATFSFTGVDPTASGISSGVHRLEYSLDGSAYVPATSPVATNWLPIGTHTFRVRAIDNAGNESAIADYTWTISLPAAPHVVSINPAAAGTYSSASSVDFVVRFSQPVTGVDAADFHVVKIGSVSTGAVSVTGSGTTYTVSVAGVSGNGGVGVNLVDNNSIRNASGFALFKPASNAAFQPYIGYTTGLASGMVPSADFNNDGKLDVVLVDKFTGGDNVGILFGNGDGTFQAPSRFRGVDGNTNVFAVDMNRDGIPDLVLTNSAFQALSTGAVMLGNGNGTFKPPQTFAMDSQAGAVDVADINGDGKPDIASASYSGRVNVLLANGDGTFKPRITYATGRGTGIRIGDLNNDGKPDLLVGNQRDDYLGAWLGNGDGTFQSPLTFTLGFVTGFALADVDGDGKIDLLATDYSNHVFRFFGKGDGTFQTPTMYPTIGNAVAIEPADLNGDGLLDVVIGQTNGGNLGFMLGTGNGNFGDFFPLTASFYITNVSIADANHDGRPDILAVSWYNSRYFSVLLNAANGSFTGQTTTIDQAAPTTTITAQPPATSLKQSATFAFSATDPTVAGIVSGVHHLEYQLDGGAFLTATSPVSLTGLAGGSHTFVVRAVDNAGNVGAAASYTWTVDTVSAPSVESIARATPAGTFTNGSSVTYTVAFNALVSGVDPTDFTTITTGTVAAGPISVSGSGDSYTVTVSGITGDGTLALRLNDNDTVVSTVNGLPIGGTGAGNSALTGPAYTVDRTAPTVAITDQPPLETVLISATFSFTGSDSTTGGVASGVHHLEYRLDGGAYATTTSPLTLNNLSRESHTFQVRAVDNVGNVGPAASYSWTVNNPPAAPYVVSINREPPSASATNSASVTYAVTFSEAVVGVDAADFALAQTGTVLVASPIVIAGSGAAYTVTLSGISGDGTLGLNLIDNTSIRDLENNVLMSSTGEFSNQTTFANGTEAFAFAAADLDSDGKIDLVSGSRTGQLGVFLGNGDGAYRPKTTALLPTGARSIAIDDFNKDDKPDIAVGSEFDGSILVLLGNGNGTFQAAATFAGSKPIEVVTADINADTFPDVVVSNYSSIAILLGNGNGTFKPLVHTSTDAAEFAAVGDLNADGKLDIAFSNRSPQYIGVLLGNGDGTFKPRMTYPAQGSPSSVAIGDLNSDGRLDLAYSSDTGKLVAAFFGNGDGTFGPRKTIVNTTPDVQQVRIADVNRDGLLDFVLADDGIAVILGNGDGTFRPLRNAAVQFGQVAVAIADLNGDGRPDIGGGGKYSQSVGVLLAKPGSFTGSTIAFDHTGPTSSIIAKPPAATQNATATFTFAANDPTVGGVASGVHHIEYQIGAGSFTTASSPLTLNGLAEGTHTFRVRAVDNAGNVGAETVATWTIDLAAPTASFLFAPPPITLASATFTFAGNDPVSNGVSSGINRFEYRLDSGAFQLAANPLTLNNLASGSHTISVRAVDNASNTGAAVDFTWIVDLFPPSVQSINRLAPAAASTNAASVTFQVTFNKIVTGVDAADFALSMVGVAATLPVVVTPVSGSVYNVTVNGIAGGGSLALDLADNGSIRDVLGAPLAPANAPAAFQAQQTYVADAPPKGATLADVNGDGKLDLLLVNTSGNSVGVYLGNGNGTFQAPRTFDADARPESVAVGDLNGDGKVDLALGNSNASGDINVLFGLAGGTFQAPVAFAAGASPYSVTIGDWNGDGKPDLAAANKAGGTVSVHLGNGNGSFQSRLTFAAGNSPLGLATGDFSGDGKADFALVNTTGNTVSVLLGNGDGNFQSRLTFATDAGPSALALGDIDVDGKLDLAVANADGNSVSVLLGNGNGSFQAQRSFATGATPLGVVIANLNGDRKPDLAVANFNGQLGVLLGNGNGSFQAQKTFAAGAGPTSVAAGDVNGDGRADLAVTNVFDNSAGVYLNAITGDFLGQSYTIDRVLPVTTITAMPPALTNNTLASFSFSATDPVSGGVSSGVNHLEYQLDGGGFITATSPRNVAGLSQGTHTFEARAVDNLGNIGFPASYTWTIDTTGPTATITAQPPSHTNSAAANFSFEAVDPLAGGVASGLDRIQYRLDGGSFTNATSPVTLSGLAAGSHTFSVRGIDKANNIGATVNYTWTVDFAGPALQAIDRALPTNATTNATSVTFAATFSEAVTGVDAVDFALALGGVAANTTLVVTPVSGSVYHVAVSGISGNGTLGLNFVNDGSIRDLVGNRLTGGGATGPTFTIDQTAPTLAIAPDAASLTASPTTFTFTFSEPVTGFSASGVALTNGTAGAFTAVNGATYTLVVTPTANGPATVSVAAGKAFDVAGNGNAAASASVTYAIPAAPTTTTLAANPNATTGGTLVTFTATIAPSSGNLGTVAFKDNGVTLSGAESVAVVGGVATFTTSALVAGNHPIRADYSGALGFAASSSNGIDFTVTSAATTTTVTAATPNPALPTQPVAITVTVAGGAPTAGDAVTLVDASNGNAPVAASGGILANGTATLSIAPGTLAAGTHNLVARYAGNSFNAPSQSAPVSLLIAAAPQVVSITPNGNLPTFAGPQRSRVVSAVVVFDRPVQLDAGALALAVHTKNVTFGGVPQPAGVGAVPTTLQFATTDNIAWTITFAGNTDNGADGLNSLRDGVYDVVVDAAKVHLLGVPGISMAANQTSTFHRLFGDTTAPTTPAGGTPGLDFDAVVNTGDNLTFRGAFNNPVNYKPYLDFNGDGLINSGDNLQFRNRFNRTIQWRV